MASYELYPPLVDPISPAFVASGDSAYCRLFFSLSKFSSSASPIRSIHISVVHQATGQSVVYKSDTDTRFRSTGIIIANIGPTAVVGEDNLYYVDILNSDIKDGWQPSWIYKIQIRLSTVEYPNNGTIGQTSWLNRESGNFSEWSTYCTTKAIAEPTIEIPFLGYNSATSSSSANEDKETTLSISTLEFSAIYSPDQARDPGELLYSYNVKLLNDDEEIIEDSGTIYTNQYYQNSKMYYLFKHELEDSKNYFIRLEYTTINKYYRKFDDFNIFINSVGTERTIINAITLDNVDNVDSESFKEAFYKQTKLQEEKEEGRIGIKLYSNDINPYNGNICIRRADSRDNFTIWRDIKIVVCIDTPINDLDIVFDYTVESGIWYKYGVQIIETNGDRGVMNPQRDPVLREWEFAYLLGEGGRQLKLMYNNTLSSYTYNYLDSKTDTIGGQYPFISRNGNVKYRTFPLGGLISFNMDENKVFTSDKELYKYGDIVEAYQTRRKRENIHHYDYRREYDFREKVLEFLQDGKPKLFKSATEGNIIVRLMQVASQPNQTLNRMICSFTSTAHEVAEATMENYLKYGFYEVGEYATSFEHYTTKLGQLEFDYDVLGPGEKLDSSRILRNNVIEEIWRKYDRSDQNVAGIRRTLQKVTHLVLEFTDKPIRVLNSGLIKEGEYEEVLGNNFMYKENKFTVRAGYTRVYAFDHKIEFTKDNSIIILGGVENIYDENGNIKNTVHVEANFLYELREEPYVDKIIESRTVKKGIGQIYDYFSPNQDIYREVYYKYYYDWERNFRRLSQISWTCIEANPGSIFLIQDDTDDPAQTRSNMYHEINQTGVLNLEELGYISDIRYIGIRNPDGSIDTSKDVDVILDYSYYVLEGTYKART